MVQAIRGATTIEKNSENDILAGTRELLLKIVERNELKSEDIISAIFTVTGDIDAAFPAAAARQIGWTDIPLLCTNEINVPGSLGKCIRTMIHINTGKARSEIRHVYLKGAGILRPDLAKENGLSKINIAIDGPAGSGKSTAAKIISRKLGIIYLDTGAMYRAVALKAIKEKIDTLDADRLSEMVRDIDIRIVYRGNEQVVLLDNENVTHKIRGPEVTKDASDVAVVPGVRLKMVELQRAIASGNSVVMDGRDIGSYVLPNAELKIYLTASVEERAKRRYYEQLNKGMKDVTLDDVRKDIEYRDMNDSTRKMAPLVKADGAVEIDTTYLTVQEVADRILSLLEDVWRLM